MVIRCHICGFMNADQNNECGNCKFILSDGIFYLSRITPQDVPQEVAERILERLRSIKNVKELEHLVPLSRPPQIGKAKSSNSRLLEAVKKLAATKTLTLTSLVESSNISIGRFSEIVVGLGIDPVPSEPFSEVKHLQPNGGLFSASRTLLEFDYEILMPGFGGKQRGIIRPFRCTSCRTSLPVLNKESNNWEAWVDVTSAIMYGETDDFQVTVTMDFSLKPYDFMVPLQKNSKTFTFPAAITLNNSMRLRVKLKGVESEMILVSKNIPAQLGIVNTWPPYGLRLHTGEALVYHAWDDPTATPILKVLDGTTYLEGPSNFLNHRADITSWEYFPSSSPNAPRPIRLTWIPVPPDSKYERQADYYYVYRNAGTDSNVGWERVSAPVYSDEWIDFAVPPDHRLLFYRVVPVWVTPLGDNFEGFPGEVARVQEPNSFYRKDMDAFLKLVKK